MAGLGRPRSSWATTVMDQPVEPDSDVNPRRQFHMSALIDSKVRAALAGAGFVKEGTFQQALDQQQRDQDQRMVSLEQLQRAINAGECPPSGLFISKVKNYDNILHNLLYICFIGLYIGSVGHIHTLVSWGIHLQSLVVFIAVLRSL